MQKKTLSFQRRLQMGFRAVKVATTPAIVLRLVLNGFVGAVTVCMAIWVTGFYILLSPFLIAHAALVLKTVVIGLLLYPLVLVPMRFIRAFLEGLFDLSKDSAARQSSLTVTEPR